MYSLIPVALITLSAILIYRKRFTSEKRIRGMYFVQAYYLIVSPIVCALLINLGLEIYNRPEVLNLALPSSLIFVLYAVAIATAGIGAGIHSTSTSVYQSFARAKQFKSDPFETNEKFHGGLSHNMLFIAAIIGFVLLSFLEVNHPSLRQSAILTTSSVIGLGIGLGLIQAIAVLRSLHLGYSLIGSLLGSIIIFYFCRPHMVSIEMFPISFVVLSGLITLFVTLFSAVLILLTSGKLSHKLLRRAYPKGHPFHEGISLKVLRIKIEREWL